MGRSECVGGGAFTERSACVRGVVQLGRPNEDGQVDTRPLSPSWRVVAGGFKAAGDYADFCLPSPRWGNIQRQHLVCTKMMEVESPGGRRWLIKFMTLNIFDPAAVPHSANHLLPYHWQMTFLFFSFSFSHNFLWRNRGRWVNTCFKNGCRSIVLIDAIYNQRALGSSHYSNCCHFFFFILASGGAAWFNKIGRLALCLQRLLNQGLAWSGR